MSCMDLQAWKSSIRSLWLVAMVLALAAQAQSGNITKAGCRSTCGNVGIPYPFGIGEGCFLPGFELSCNTTLDPPAPFLGTGNVKVYDIFLLDGYFTIEMGISYICYNSSTLKPEGWNTWWIDIAWPNLFFSTTRNRFMAIGCDTVAFMDGIKGGSQKGGGCMSVCSSPNDASNGSCSGIGCCEVSIPKGLKNYNVSISSRQNHSGVVSFNPCSYAFLVQNDAYQFAVSDLRRMNGSMNFPVAVDWSIGNQSCEIAATGGDYACVSVNSVCFNSSTESGYLCRCTKGFQGNPFLPGGCQDIDECKGQSNPCNNRKCINTHGGFNCSCEVGTYFDPIRDECITIITDSKSTAAKGIIIGVSCGLGVLLIVGSGALFSRKYKKRREQQQREKFFKENHGLLLQQLISSDDTAADNTKIFTLKELEKATNNFDDTRIIGTGGHGVVYKGLLSDQRVVAIKKSREILHSEITQFINEVAILSQVNHRNVVKLFGCCLEIEVPLLVYEFISNGTLSDHLHVWDRKCFLSWDHRLRIATEIARALGYLHSAVSMPIIHRDLKSVNILLDETLTAKISDFGASKSISLHDTHITTAVQGTFGYLDPEYFHTGQLTEKSDVYSLGVILVELLTGQKPVSQTRSEDERNLISRFSWALKDKQLFQIMEGPIVKEATREEVEEVAMLAESCLRLRKEERPTMKEIELTLENLRRPKKKKEYGTRNLEETRIMLHEASTILNNQGTSTQFSLDGQQLAMQTNQPR